MTTIAYNHKDREIAVDSRTTRGGMIVSDESNKMHEVNGVKFFIAGFSSDDQEIIDSYFNGKQGVKSCANNKNVAIVADGGEIFRCAFDDGDGFFIQAVKSNDAAGSGFDFAIAAMDFGKSASEAVEYAMTRDVYTGGKVYAYKV